MERRTEKRNEGRKERREGKKEGGKEGRRKGKKRRKGKQTDIKLINVSVIPDIVLLKCLLASRQKIILIVHILSNPNLIHAVIQLPVTASHATRSMQLWKLSQKEIKMCLKFVELIKKTCFFPSCILKEILVSLCLVSNLSLQYSLQDRTAVGLFRLTECNSVLIKKLVAILLALGTWLLCGECIMSVSKLGIYPSFFTFYFFLNFKIQELIFSPTENEINF